ncbi:polysaccharide pyruvyl transferase family protein [Microbacterium jiangjiandongii]|uniref:polysaccharide pyruvyl transferase family protein n=1 Tax=Microbacterium jiangjiandongii TaxID=3049071 RepID=UPI00214C64B6|nr:polysaccharide pyruvyl transferase family protein [Microbacterium sp. zg.Y843]MCR2815876.1 polysaccharide pyruvyl transferase family protein [Microbacterium sp. zg.Y843]
MTSVGIMTMHRIYNYGSSLQAFALRRLIEQAAPGAAVTYVDYEPGECLLPSPETGSSGETGMARIISKVREYGQVQAPLRDKIRFFNHKRTYASKYFRMIGIPESRNRNLALDLQVIGSDEVFNCVQSNVNVGYSKDLFGHDSPARSVISYAGSFGNTTLDKVEASGIADELARSFNAMDAVSVRDLNSQRIVEALTGTAPEIHLDPTLVYDFEGDTRNKRLRTSEPYIIVYGYSGRMDSEENAAVRSYADRIGARVLAFGGLQACADELIDCDPFTLLDYFRGASGVITDTFHGTIFSIISEVPFATIIRTSSGHGYGNEEKLGFLLNTLGFADRALKSATELATLMSSPIDFAPARAIRARESERTRAYLAAALTRAGELSEN